MTLSVIYTDCADTSPVDAPHSKFRQHDKYWLDDGSIVLLAQNDLFKVHRSLLHRHSNTLPTLSSESSGKVDSIDGLAVVHIPEELDVRSRDLEALLEHLYHDVPLDETTSFSRASSILRISSKHQLDFPSIHALARSRIERMFPTRPEAFFRFDAAQEALELSIKYDIPSIRKALYYTVATRPHEHDVQGPDADPDLASAVHPVLAPELAERCNALLEQLVAHFTPILFTVATAGHMMCTDVFAEKWMELVIQPALDDNGLCRPLETLERIIAIDWATEGLCGECVKDKIEEWRGEQTEIWARMDEWLR